MIKMKTNSFSIWGIGLAADDPRAKGRSTWLGTNWLGEAIQRVREDIRTGKIKF